MKKLNVLGVMRALLVAGMSVAEEDQRGQAPRKNVSAGAIWHEIIRCGEFCLRAGSGRVAGNTITRDARPYRRTLRNAGRSAGG